MNAPLNRKNFNASNTPVSVRVETSPQIMPVSHSSLDYIRNYAPNEPILCFSPSILAENLSQFRNGFPGEVSYAVKANPATEVLFSLVQNGLRVFDVASTAEMMQVANICSTAEFHYHNPVKSRQEIQDAHDIYHCRRFAADCIEEIEKIAEVIGATSNIEIAIRFRLPSQGGAAHDFSSKFGTTPEQASKLLATVKAMGFIPVLTFHPGSQCTDITAWIRHIAAAAEIAANADVTLAVLNTGGGFPAHYPASNGPELSSIFDRILNAVTTYFAADAIPYLECEPGRAMVASSMSLITQVKLVKKQTKEVYLNDGIYGSLLEGAQVQSLRPAIRVSRIDAITSATEENFTIYGPTCDPLDVLPGSFRMPADISEGDFVEFSGLGAYGLATTTGFNGYGQAKSVRTTEVFNA